MRRNGWLAIAALVGAAGYGLWWTGGPSGVPSRPSDAVIPTVPADAWRITFAGDTLIGDGASKRIRKHGVDWVFSQLGDLIRGDAFVLNLEAPLTTLRRDDVPGSERAWTYDMPPSTAGDLLRLGVTHVGFANNHSLDRGEQGLLDTLASSRDAGLPLFGAGADRASAGAPLLLDTTHGRVAVLAFTYAKAESQEATEDRPGVVFLGPRTVREGMQRARTAGADHVIGFVHWGRNYSAISNWQRHAARWFANAGYDAVIGHGPHVQQPVGRLKDTLIVYSLGNFVFNSPGRFAVFDQPTYGLTATVVVAAGGPLAIELRCVQADNQKTNYRPRPCSATESADAFGRLGGLVLQDDDRGVIPW